MPISSRENNNKSGNTSNNNDQDANNKRIEEELDFVKQRIVEMANKLEHIDDDVERIAFVLALFGKYMQYHSDKNKYIVDKNVIELAIVSVNTELTRGYGEEEITDFEQEMIIYYLEKIQSKMYELSDEERKKLT